MDPIRNKSKKTDLGPCVRFPCCLSTADHAYAWAWCDSSVRLCYRCWVRSRVGPTGFSCPSFGKNALPTLQYHVYCPPCTLISGFGHQLTSYSPTSLSRGTLTQPPPRSIAWAVQPRVSLSLPICTQPQRLCVLCCTVPTTEPLLSTPRCSSPHQGWISYLAPSPTTFSHLSVHLIGLPHVQYVRYLASLLQPQLHCLHHFTYLSTTLPSCLVPAPPAAFSGFPDFSDSLRARSQISCICV